MGIDSGNNAEKAIAMELKHLNKKLDRLIDILAKKDAVLKIDESGITMAPKIVYKDDVPLCVEPEKENEQYNAPDPEWHAAADRYISYSTNGPGRSDES